MREGNSYFVEMRTTPLWQKILLSMAVIGAAAYLLFLVDDNLGLEWPNNVLRNWQEFGAATLHWNLVYNPGGYEAIDHAQVYKGMSPVFLFPVYAVTELFNWTGLDALSFDIVLLVAIAGGIWVLLGGDHFALLVALIAVLCPGYMRSLKELGPDPISTLPVIPYAAIMLTILKKPKFTAGGAIVVLVLTLGFLSLNWMSAWVCGPFIFLLLGMKGLNRRAMIFLVTVMVVGVPVLAALSVAAKYGAGKAVEGNVAGTGVLGNYFWGSEGYGGGLTTGRAFLRLAFYNGISLLPLWLLFIYAAGQRAWSGAKFSWWMFAPLALAAANLVIMRNYFGHHPPMAGAVLLAGLIFSLVLLRTPSAEEVKVQPSVPFGFVPVLAALGFAYGLAFLIFFRANDASMLALEHLVRAHTARSDVMVILKTDTGTAGMVERLEEPLDRHVIVADKAEDSTDGKDHLVILSAVPLDNSFSLVAQSAPPSQTWLNKVTDWFNQTIAKRSPGDRLEMADTYYLYEPRGAH